MKKPHCGISSLAAFAGSQPTPKVQEQDGQTKKVTKNRSVCCIEEILNATCFISDLQDGQSVLISTIGGHSFWSDLA
jgi:hypothetical protein